MRYISLFSGIGGLEHPAIPPLLFCERDNDCQAVLRRRYDGTDVLGDIVELTSPPRVELVVGGWPCQDLSSAGTRGGIRAKRSGLFFEMLRVARLSGAHTIVGENVPNLLTINRGRDFQVVLDAFAGEGFPYVSWRVLNARSFGLPQERRRVFVVASKERARAMALHAQVPDLPMRHSDIQAHGFYWTGGKRSICFSSGFAPTLKIGATDNKGRAPVAVYIGGLVRKLTPSEFLRLQGFVDLPIEGLAPSTVLRMAGNAVPVAMGNFVLQSVERAAPAAGMQTAFGVVAAAGIMDNGMTWVVDHPPRPLATNLADFLDPNEGESLSAQAAAGLLVRSARSGHVMPRELFEALFKLSEDRSAKLRPSRANSFEALDAMGDALLAYQTSLPAIADYKPPAEGDDELEGDNDDEFDG